MDKDLWLLLEWVEKEGSFSEYVVRSTCNLMTFEKSLPVGKVVYVCDKVNGIARQAKIVKVCDFQRSVRATKSVLKQLISNKLATNSRVCYIDLCRFDHASLIELQYKADVLINFPSFDPRSDDVLSQEKKDYIDMLRIMLNKNRKEGKTFIFPRVSDPEKADQDSGSVDSVGPVTDSSTPVPSGSSEDIDTDQESEPTTYKQLPRPVVSSIPIPDTNAPTLKLKHDVGTQVNHNSPVLEERLEDNKEKLDILMETLQEAFIVWTEKMGLKVDEHRFLLDDTFNESLSDECVEVSRIQDKSADQQITPSHKYNLRKKTIASKKIKVSAQQTDNSLPSTSKNDEMVASGSGYVTLTDSDLADLESKFTATKTMIKQLIQRISQDTGVSFFEFMVDKVVKRVFKQIDRENVPTLTESSNESDDTPD